VGNVQASAAAGGFKLGDAAFFYKLGPLLSDGGARFVGGVWRSVKQHDAAASLRGYLRNAAPHGASADDADGRKNGGGMLCHSMQYSADLK
jgi:hypothetical protein